MGLNQNDIDLLKREARAEKNPERRASLESYIAQLERQQTYETESDPRSTRKTQYTPTGTSHPNPAYRREPSSSNRKRK
jgi:hypothetical protein